MDKVNRRRLLASLGTLSGSALLAGVGTCLQMDGTLQADDLRSIGGSETGPRWDYVKLDPAQVGETAYRIYSEGGCMYAVVGSVIGALAELKGEPFRSFPLGMMRYGAGGVGHWGSVCGIVNGASSLIGLFHSEVSKESREAMIAEFCLWYETTALPAYKPEKPHLAADIDASVAGSVLCHISTIKWCEASAYDAYSAEKKERCMRFTADGAMKVVEILNRKADDAACEFASLTADVKSCVDCHGKKELADATGKMSCNACHQFEKKHP